MPKAWYMLILKTTNLSPSDWSNYMLWHNTTTTGTATNWKCAIPQNGSIKEITFSATVWWTLWSNETATIYLNRNWTSSDILLSSSIVFNAVNNTVTIGGLNIVLSTSDYINIQISCPTRATNPISVDIVWYVWIE